MKIIIKIKKINKEFIKKEKGIILSNEKLNSLGYNNSGCCGGKAKARRKKYEDILKENNGEIDSIFLGSDGVGKTSLIKRIDGKDFDENEKHTEDLTKYETFYFNSTMKITLNIYDINNEKKKNNIIEQILKKCQIYFLVYDLNDMRSIKEVKYWLNIIINLKKNNSKPSYVIAIIGNKKDLLHNKQNLDINNIEINKFKEEHLINEINSIFYLTDAKSNSNEIKDIIGISVEKFINLP
jgi:GTPase SAR1 family protein